ncbi:hypothetical protein ECDEC6D_3615 [Escherichia coli DEC6D]|nr:hypothetical protein ECDEC6D_3615 [Escherichia coli DEC6D]
MFLVLFYCVVVNVVFGLMVEKEKEDYDALIRKYFRRRLS